MHEQAASASALLVRGVWVVTGLVSAKAFSMKSIGLCSDTDGGFTFETVLSEGYEVIRCFNVSHTQKRALCL